MTKPYLAVIYLLAILFTISCQQKDQQLNDTSKTQISGQGTTGGLAVESSYPIEIPTGRLPEHARPTMYWLDLTIDPDTESFSGQVTINIELETPTQHLWLHGKDLDAQSVEATLSDGRTISGTYQEVDPTGIVKLSFQQPLPLGSLDLRIRYQAPFNKSLEGLYQTQDGDLNYAFTQFQTTAARSAFPGFDEPAFKTPFNYTLTVRTNHKAFTNSPITSEADLGNGWKEVVYARTQPLPTYLIAFAVGDFDVVEWQSIPPTDVRDREVPLRGIATKGKGKQLNYALENTKSILHSLEDYFQIPYPYAKLDIVAVPDFAFGAMENAGLITYREQLLLFDGNPSLQQKQSYMIIHAHELAHQWFGNLVTPVWWDDIWLNEAFATWMGYVANDAIYPEQGFQQKLLSRSLDIMTADSLISARQIRQPIKHNKDISSAFDGITYLKGGGVLRMLEAFLGPEDFRAGIQHYLRTFEFRNATAQDFIIAIGEKSSKEPVETIRSAFNSFLEQPGIPHLNVEIACEESKHTSVTINQSRYLPLGSKGSTAQTWKVPACFKYGINDNQHHLCKMLEDQQQTFELPEQGCPTYFMPNANGAGYYRFSLSNEGWQSLLNKQSELSTEEIMSINNSLEAAINAGKLTFTGLVKIAPNIIASESSEIVMEPSKLLSFAYHKVAQSDEQKSRLAKLNRSLYSPRLAKLGLATPKDDSANRIQLRYELIHFLSKEGEDKDIRQYLTDMAIAYTGYKTDGKIHASKADSNMIGVAIKVAAEDLGKPFAQHLKVLLDSSADGTIRGRMLNGLGAVTDPEYAAELRELILSDSLRDNEIGAILLGQMETESLRQPMWEWFKTNFDGIKGRVPPFSQGILPIVGGYFCSEPMKQDYVDFFTPIISDLPGAPRAFNQKVEAIELCVAQVEFHKKDVNDYLERQ